MVLKVVVSAGLSIHADEDDTAQQNTWLGFLKAPVPPNNYAERFRGKLSQHFLWEKLEKTNDFHSYRETYSFIYQHGMSSR